MTMLLKQLVFMIRTFSVFEIPFDYFFQLFSGYSQIFKHIKTLVASFKHTKGLIAMIGCHVLIKNECIDRDKIPLYTYL